MLRRLVELVSRDRVIRRQLPRDFGARPLYVSPDAALRLWLPITEKTDALLFKLVRDHVKPGAIVWDLGANVGLFTFAAAAAAGETGSVLAIEPDPWLASLLSRSAGPFSKDAPVFVLSVAISDQLGISRFNVARRGRCSNFVSAFGRMEAAGGRCSFPVPTVTLDWLSNFFPPPTVIKIDIEGMEHLALRGASKVLKSRPLIIAEVAEENKVQVRECLHGYEFFMTNMQPATSVPNNLIAI